LLPHQLLLLLQSLRLDLRLRLLVLNGLRVLEGLLVPHLLL
jgi:hypothetical protein